jgi:drug/metabolite transporter (DMT)-like permease
VTPAGQTSPRTRRQGLSGLVVAGIAAVISGVSVFVNSYGVHAVTQPSVYTAAKNLVAAAVLAVTFVAAWGWRLHGQSAVLRRWIDPPDAPVGARRPVGGGADVVGVGADAVRADTHHRPAAWRRRARLVALAYVGVVGGGVAFVLFFNGLARTSATPAAFVRDTLVVWVALLAGPFLHERVTAWNLAAIALLVGGEIAISRGVGGIGWGSGQAMILAATLLWAVEVVIAKWLLADLSPGSLSLVRMGVGAIVLVGYVLATGAGRALVSLDAVQLGWVLLTGALLAAYVGAWFTALARARAVDVTSILVASALVTALLQALAGTQPLAPEALGLLLIIAGTCVVAATSLRRQVA